MCNISAVIPQWGELGAVKLNPAGQGGSAAFVQHCPAGWEGEEIPVGLEFLLLWHPEGN